MSVNLPHPPPFGIGLMLTFVYFSFLVWMIYWNIRKVLQKFVVGGWFFIFETNPVLEYKPKRFFTVLRVLGDIAEVNRIESHPCCEYPDGTCKCSCLWKCIVTYLIICCEVWDDTCISLYNTSHLYCEVPNDTCGSSYTSHYPYFEVREDTLCSSRPTDIWGREHLREKFIEGHSHSS